MVGHRKKLLVFVVAYNAQNTIEWVLNRVPVELCKNFDVEVLVIDDASLDATFDIAMKYARQHGKKFKFTVLCNEKNQGYGGNQKLGYHYAIKNDFDLVALIHGDGQYPPEEIFALSRPLIEQGHDASFGSRMMVPYAALRGGMPIYKYVGNRVLTSFQNLLLGSKFSEFHSGFRMYSVEALKHIPFELNSNDFHFDTEIIIQLLFAGKKINEIPIPTFYGEEICHVNGMKYALDVIRVSLRARMQSFNLLQDKRFMKKSEGEGEGEGEKQQHKLESLLEIAQTMSKPSVKKPNLRKIKS